MKKIVFFTGLLFVALSIQTPAYAAKMNCKKFSAEIENLKTASLKHQKELNSIDTQMQSGTKAINDFNKNCRATSNPKCNSGTYNMITMQMTMLNGQRQKVESQIIDAATKQEEATKSLRLCNSVKVQKATL